MKRRVGVSDHGVHSDLLLLLLVGCDGRCKRVSTAGREDGDAANDGDGGQSGRPRASCTIIPASPPSPKYRKSCPRERQAQWVGLRQRSWRNGHGPMNGGRRKGEHWMQLGARREHDGPGRHG